MHFSFFIVTRSVFASLSLSLSLSLSPYNMRTLSFKNQYNFFKIIRLVKILCTSGSYFFIRSIFYILVFYNTRVHLTYIK